MPENGIDEDWDGMDGVRRRLLERSLSQPPWTWSGSVAYSGLGTDRVRIGDGTNAGSVSRNYSFAIPQGRVHAVMGLTANTNALGTACELMVWTEKGSPPVPGMVFWTISGQGIGSVATGDLGVQAAGRTLKGLHIDCDAGASVTIDWLVLQNTDDAIPPVNEIDLQWGDLGMPGGGLAATIVRDDAGFALYAGSDVGGAARMGYSLAGSEPWAMITGSPDSGGLVSQPDLSVWDILPSSWGELFALTGRNSGGSAVGGFWSSIDEGATWQLIADSDPTPDNNDANEVTLAAYGRYTACGDTKAHGGGRLLVEEPDSEGVFIANHDDVDLGLTYYDMYGDLCLLATADLPAEPIGAMAWVESATSAEGALVVGYRTTEDPTTADGLFVCYREPVFPAVSTFTCDIDDEWVCDPILDAQGLDIRDLEVDPNDASVVYVADGGDFLSDTDGDGELECTDESGGVYVLDIDDDGAGIVSGQLVHDLTAGLAQVADGTVSEVTGVSMDPDGDFLFAFAPYTPGANYSFDRIYRIAAADIGTGADWQPINQELTDEADREANLDLAGGMLDASYTNMQALPRVYPARYAPGYAIDGVWFKDEPAGPGDGCSLGGQNYSMLMVTTFNLWRVEGLDGGCDGSAWDPELDTQWTFGPDVQEPNGKAWQYTAVTAVAWDPHDNIWATAADVGLWQYPDDGDEAAELDCLWDALNAGGQSLSVAGDGTLWATFYDEGGGIPHHIGVVRRTEDAGGAYAWEYETAAAYNATFDLDVDGFRDHLWCGEDDTYYATPFGEDPFGGGVDQYEGNAFMDTGSASSETDNTVDSWGQPWQIAALDSETAVVGFRGYTHDSIEVPGRIAFTVDGGVTWESASFDGDWDADPATADCDEYDYFAQLNGLALIHDPDRTYNDGTDADGDGVVDGYRLEFFVTSRYTGTDNNFKKNCGLARVTLDGSTGTAEWTWYGLDRTATTPPLCKVDASNLRGVETAPWGTDAFIWGNYRLGTAPTRYGGVCAIDLDDPSLRSILVNPQQWQYTIGAVAAHPYVADLLAVAPLLDTSTWEACHTDGEGDCPNPPKVMLGERSASGWTFRSIPGGPPHLAGNALAWTGLDMSALVYGSAGGGAWKGDLKWK